MTARTRRRLAAALTAGTAILLTGCTGGGDVAGVDLAPTGTATSTPRAVPTNDKVDIPALRAAAALDPCPTSGSASASGSGDGLPDVTLDCLGDGPGVALDSLRGPYVVNLWASWCPECTDEAPYLAEVYADPGRTVNFLGVAYDDTVDRALTAADELDMRYPSVWSDDNSLRAPLRIPGLPITIFVDSTGREVGRKTGAITSACELRGLIEQYLGVHE